MSSNVDQSAQIADLKAAIDALRKYADEQGWCESGGYELSSSTEIAQSTHYVWLAIARLGKYFPNEHPPGALPHSIRSTWSDLLDLSRQWHTLTLTDALQLRRCYGGLCRWLEDRIRELSETPSDDLITLDQAAVMVGQSKRTLERWFQNGELPEPAVRGVGGRPHRWFWSAIRPSLEKHRPNLPIKFPASRTI